MASRLPLPIDLVASRNLSRGHFGAILADAAPPP